MDDVPPLRAARPSDGVTIAYQVFGQGPALVWLPSLSSIVAQWRVPLLRNAYQVLARSMTVVLYDGRGTGGSDRRVDPDDLGVEVHLRDLAAVVDAAGPDRPSLLGVYHSVATAIAFAAEQPARVRRTPREREVLRLIAAGDSNAEIARALGIAVHTVERHAANLYRKIGARGRADATAYALRRGLTCPELTWPGLAWPGLTWPGLTWPDLA